jgi:hypothetical protein
MFQPFVFDGEAVRLRTGNDPAIPRIQGHLRYIVAADLGSAKDPTGITVIEDRQIPMFEGAWRLGPRQRTLVWADRLREHRYTEIVDHLSALLRREPMAGRARLAIDASGVGRGVSDTLDLARIPHVAVQMTAGSSVRQVGKYHNVSKQVLITDLATALETGGLKMAADLRMREELLIELESFQTRASASGVQVLDAGGADNHADMAVSLAIGWFASEQLGGFVGEGQLEGWF